MIVPSIPNVDENKPRLPITRNEGQRGSQSNTRPPYRIWTAPRVADVGGQIGIAGGGRHWLAPVAQAVIVEFASNSKAFAPPIRQTFNPSGHAHGDRSRRTGFRPACLAMTDYDHVIVVSVR